MSLLLRSKQFNIIPYICIMCKMHRYVQLCFFFFFPTWIIYRIMWENLPGSVIFPPISCTISYLFYQSVAKQTMSQASSGSCARQRFQSSTLTPFLFGLSLFDPFLALAFDLFFFLGLFSFVVLPSQQHQAFLFLAISNMLGNNDRLHLQSDYLFFSFLCKHKMFFKV